MYLGRRTVGFVDRPELPDTARVVIARFARRFSPEALDAEQRRLLDSFDADPAPKPSDLLVALAADEADLAKVYELGLFETISVGQLELARDPSRVPGLAGRTYPLSMSEAAELTGATQRQLRTWADAGLIVAVRIGGERMFMRGSVLRAMVLGGAPRFSIATLLAAAKGTGDGMRALQLIGAQLLERNGKFVARFGAAAEDAGRFLIKAGSGFAVSPRAPSSALPTRAPTVRKEAAAIPKRLARSHVEVQRSDVMARNQWVVKHGEKWAQRGEGNTRVTRTFDTQGQAIEAARQTAQRSHSELFIQGEDGKIRDRSSYGNDPYPPKG
jgi:hypothetical protein